MGLFENTPATYMKIKDGRIIIKENDEEKTFNGFRGFLKSIVFKESELEFNGKKQIVKQWNVHFYEPDEDKNYIWSTFWTGLLFQGFLNCICSVENFDNQITIKAYKKDDITKIVVFEGDKGEPLKWKYTLEEMPPVNPIVVNGKVLKDSNDKIMYDYKARMEWTASKVEEINKRIRTNNLIDDEIRELEIEDVEPAF
jgi:hypothetical protein